MTRSRSICIESRNPVHSLLLDDPLAFFKKNVERVASPTKAIAMVATFHFDVGFPQPVDVAYAKDDAPFLRFFVNNRHSHCLTYFRAGSFLYRPRDVVETLYKFV